MQTGTASCTSGGLYVTEHRGLKNEEQYPVKIPV